MLWPWLGFRSGGCFPFVSYLFTLWLVRLFFLPFVQFIAASPRVSEEHFLRLFAHTSCLQQPHGTAATVGVLPDVDRTLHRNVARHYLESALYTFLATLNAVQKGRGKVSVPC